MIKIVGRFSELANIKNEIMMKLISSDNIVKALANAQFNFLDTPTPNPVLYSDSSKDPAVHSLSLINEPTRLIYEQIFPFLRVPSPTDTAKTFITLRFSYLPEGAFFKTSTVYFHVFTHSSLIRTAYSTLRYDYIINEIDTLFNHSRGLGIGRLNFSEMSDFQVNDNWLGAYVGYKPLEFS